MAALLHLHLWDKVKRSYKINLNKGIMFYATL